MTRYRNSRGPKATPVDPSSHSEELALKLQLRTVEISARLAPLCCVWAPEDLEPTAQVTSVNRKQRH